MSAEQPTGKPLPSGRGAVTYGDWTDERVELLKKLWAEGLSASVCARRLGGFDHCIDGGRSAVIGKVHRLKLNGRATNRVHRAPVKRKPAPKPPRKPMRVPTPLEVLFKVEDPMIPIEEIVVPKDKRKGILQLESGDCKWPIGDPKEPDFHFCHHKAVSGLPYCEVHSRRAYAPPKPASRAGVAAGAVSSVAGRDGTPGTEIATSGQISRKLETAG